MLGRRISVKYYENRKYQYNTDTILVHVANVQLISFIFKPK